MGEMTKETDQGSYVWPQNTWAVTDNGDPLEAMLENAGQGVYHGYPMPQDDPFRAEVPGRWNAR